MITITNIHKLKQTYSHRHIAYFWVLSTTTNYLFMPYYRTGFLIETFSYTNRLLKIAGLASISHSCTDWFHQMNLYQYNSNRSMQSTIDRFNGVYCMNFCYRNRHSIRDCTSQNVTDKKCCNNIPAFRFDIRISESVL